MRTVIAALGGSSAFTAATISAGLRDTSVAGFFVSVRDVKAPNVAGLALRTPTVVPMTPAEAATTIASRVAYDIGQVGDAVAVFASTWAANGGFPADTNKLPQQLFDVMQPQMPLLAELCLADNSLSPFAFTCLTEFTYPTNNLFLVRNSSFPCRQDYVFQGEDFAGMQYKTTRCTYNPLTRTWYVGAVANAGQLGALPAIATATTGVVFIPIGITYTVPGTSVTGVVTGSAPTGAISAHIRQLLTGLGGTSAVVYEVATSHVLAVSWNESVLDYSRYNISMANPIIDIKTLDTISGSFAVRTVIAALGGSSAFTAATISAGLRDTSVAGFFVSVRDVKAPNVAGLALRTLTVVPMTPAEAATTIASRVAYDIGQVGDAVAVFARHMGRQRAGFPA